MTQMRKLAPRHAAGGTAWLRMTTILTCLALAPAVQAQNGAPAASAVTSFDIPAQPLGSALNAFINATGWQVSYPSSAVRGKTSPGVSGAMSAADALQRLIGGSGLTMHRNGASAAALVAAPAGSASATTGEFLGTITIEGSAGLGWDGTAETIYTTPGSVAHISEEEITRFRGSSAGDFLSGTPGVINADNRNSGALDVNIRGMQGFGRVPVVVDGGKQQNTIYRGYAGVAERTYLDPDLIGNVAIQKGPASGVHGTGAVGGVVVMDTISARDILRDGKTSGFRIVAGYVGNTSPAPAPRTLGGLQLGGYLGTGNWSTNPGSPFPTLPTDINTLGAPGGMDRPGLLTPTGGHASIAFAATGEHFEFVTAIARRRQGNFHAGANGDGPVVYFHEVGAGSGNFSTRFPEVNRYRLGEEILNTSQDNTSLLAKLLLRGGNGHSIEFAARRYDSDFGEIMPSVLVDAGPTQAPLSEVRSDALSARYRWNPEDNDLIDLRVNLWANTTDTTNVTPYNLFGFYLYDSPFKSVENRWGADVSNLSVIETGMGRLALNYGLSYSYERIRPSDEPYPVGNYPVAPLGSRDGWRKESSAFINAEWDPTDRLKVMGGLRYTHVQAYDNLATRIQSGPFAGQLLNNREKGSGWAPSLAVSYDVAEGVQVYARYSEALRMPSLFESTGSGPISSWSYDPAPLYDALPERAKTFEIGTNLMRHDIFAPGDRLGVKLAVFNNKVDDFLTRTTVTSGQLAPGMPSTTIRNLHSATFRGVELAADYDSGRYFVQAGATWMDKTEFCLTATQCYGGGVPGGYVNQNVPPKLTASATLGMRLLEEKLTVGTRVTHMGKRAAGATDIGQGMFTVVDWKPYTLVDAFASYEITPDARLDIGIDNLADTYYMDTLTLGYNPSPGRTFRLSLTAKF